MCSLKEASRIHNCGFTGVMCPVWSTDNGWKTSFIGPRQLNHYLGEGALPFFFAVPMPPYTVRCAVGLGFDTPAPVLSHPWGFFSSYTSVSPPG